jgi:hypothetical protein
MLLVVFIAASAFVWWLMHVVYHGAMAWVATRLGIVVEEVSIGIGPTLYRGEWGSVPWCLKLVPTSGSTRCQTDQSRGDSSLPSTPGSFDAAPKFNRLLVLLAGPAATIVMGLLLLGVAIVTQAPQLVANEGAARDAPLLATDASPTSWHGQFRLLKQTAAVYVLRLLTFQSLDGWGGLVALLVTAGRFGAVSMESWATIMGIAALAIGLGSLLPIPLINGWKIAELFAATLLRQARLPERVTLLVAYVGVVYYIVLLGRIVWLDIGWTWRNVID